MKTAMKLCALISLILLTGFFVIIAVFFHRGRGVLIQAEEARLATSAELYASAIRNAMLSGQASLALRMTSSLKSGSDFLEAELYRPDGSSAFHDYSTLDLVNSRQNRLFFPRAPRRQNEPSTDAALREAAESAKPRILVLSKEKRIDYWFPLLNYVECRQCHGGSPFVRGVLHLSSSTAPAGERAMGEARFLSVAGIALIAACWAGILLFLRGRAAVFSDPVKAQNAGGPSDFLESLKSTAEGLAAELGKHVRLETRTNGIFPLLPDSIRGPLILFVRNSLMHGIESPDVRAAAGKPEEGAIEITFEGSAEAGFKIVFSDDGGGLDFHLLEDRARAMNLIPAGTVPVPKETLLRLLFSPGLGANDPKGSPEKARGRPGLAETYEIVRQNRWRILVATRHGGGMKISLIIPGDADT